MSWFKNLFVSKEKMALREKAKEIWRNICVSLKDLGEELVLYEEKKDGFCEARTCPYSLMDKAQASGA